MDLFLETMRQFVSLLANPGGLLWIFVGVILGFFMGIMPGLTATLGIALLIPLTLKLHSGAAIGLAMMVAEFCAGIYAGSFTAILLGIPGTPASAATVFDGHALAKRGRAGEAIGMASVSSFIGGILSGLVMIFASSLIVGFALAFQAPEYFVLAIYGLLMIAIVRGKSIFKGLISGALGLLVASIGMDPITAFPRFTFGNLNLLQGVSLIPALIGLFGLAQTFESLLTSRGEEKKLPVAKVNRIIPSWQDFRNSLGTILRGTAIGTLIGAIPGTGTDLAAFISYGQAKNASKEGDKFGTGVLEGVAAAESANNAVTGGALIPTLTLGVPGEAATAVLLGGLMAFGLRPGPALFRDNLDLVGTVYASFFLANLMFLILGLSLARYISKIVLIPSRYLVPTIMILCFVGAFAMRNSVFDIFIAIIFGVLGFIMNKLEIPVAPMLLGIILGPMAESNLRRTFMLYGVKPSIFFTRPICIAIWVIVGLTFWFFSRAKKA